MNASVVRGVRKGIGQDRIRSQRPAMGGGCLDCSSVQQSNYYCVCVMKIELIEFSAGEPLYWSSAMQ